MRWVIRILGALAVLLVLAIGAALLIPAERIAQVAADRIAQATGRVVTISGDATPTLWPDLGVVIEGLSIGNPRWAGDAPMIAAERVNVGVAWGSLFSGDIRVERAVLEGAQIMLVRAADGRVSWDIGGDGDTAAPAADAGDAPAGPSRQVGFDEAVITGARVRYLDLEGGADWDVAGLDASIRLPEAGGAVSIEGRGQVNGTELEIAGTIDSVAGLLAGEARPVAVDVTWRGGTAGFDGQLALDATAEGALVLEATTLQPLAALAGADMPDLPRGLGRERVAVTGNVTLSREGSVHLRQAELRLDQTVLNVALDLVPGEDRPMLRGTITGGDIALPGLMGGAGGGGGGGGSGEAGSAAPGWPRDVIDVSGLFATDAEVTVRTQSLDLGTVQLSDIDLRATLTRGRLVFDIASIGTYGGQLAGQFVINGRGGLSVGGDLLLANVELQPLLTAAAGWDRLQGTGSASVEFLGVGNDLHTIMDGLEAEGDVTLGQGAILGLDLAGMLRNFDLGFRGEGQRTVYDRVSADFIVRDGVLRNDDLLLDAPWGEVRGEGEADLAAMSVDYLLTPGVRRDAEGVAQLRVPIRVEGPWAGPQIRPDLEALAELELAEERERLEEEARERLEAETERLEELARERANEVLGTQIEAGDTPEDIRRAIEDAAAEELRRLLLGDEN